MLSRRIWKELLFIVVISTLLGLGVNYTLIKRYVQEEFRESFFSSVEYPSIAFITLAEAEELFSQGEAIFIDSRPEEDYRKGHILGALNIPFEEQKKKDLIAQHSFPQGQTLVVYCDGDACQSSVELAKILHQHHFTSIRVFFGGWTEWIKAGLPRSAEND